MKNYIEYFYGINAINLSFNNKYYTFLNNNYEYRLYLYENEDVNFLININNELVGKCLVSEIIYNRNNEILSFFNNNIYILIRIFVNSKKLITLEEIDYLSRISYKDNLKINWGELWSIKIDFLENLINENGKKYPIIVDSFNYFVGMAENAISYFNNINIENNYKFYVSHRMIRFNDTVVELYNPLNIIYDYKVRDIAEYIKNSFFLDNKNIFNEFKRYISKNILTITDVKLLVARLLYPSFYFEMYEDIIIDSKEEKIILDVVNKLNDYEKYLSFFIDYLRTGYDIQDIDWLKKNR